MSQHLTPPISIENEQERFRALRNGMIDQYSELRRENREQAMEVCSELINHLIEVEDRLATLKRLGVTILPHVELDTKAKS